MPLDPAIPPLSAEKRIRTIWCIKIEATPEMLLTNYREGVTVAADDYVYRPGLEVGALSIAPQQLQTTCEISFSDVDASAVHLVLDSANLKVPVTILRLWWDGATWTSETYFSGKLGRPYADALVTRVEIVARVGRTGKATKTPWCSVLVDHDVLGPSTTIEVG